jgi:hypothetical protein
MSKANRNNESPMPFRSLNLLDRSVRSEQICLVDVFPCNSFFMFLIFFCVIFTYSDEELNYFKFASIVLKEFPDALRIASL